MPFGYQGASSRNDDVIDGVPTTDAERKGYLGDSEHISSSGVNQDANPSWSPTGQGNAIVNGWKQPGTSAYDKDVDRYRDMGADSQKRGAVVLDQTAADQSRKMQLGALGLLSDAARGNAPSRAAELGRTSTEQVLHAQAGNLAAGRGPGAAIAGANAAGNGAATKMGQANAAITDARAAEIAQAQNQYSGGAMAARGQDIGAATTNAQLEAQQRQLNELRQQRFEQLGFDTRSTQQQAADDWLKEQERQENIRNQQALEEQARDDAVTNTAISTGLAVGQGIAHSDVRTKRNILPLGSLARRMQRRS